MLGTVQTKLPTEFSAGYLLFAFFTFVINLRQIGLISTNFHGYTETL